MQTIEEKLKNAILEKTKSIERTKSEIEQLEKHKRYIRRYPLKWNDTITIRNAKRSILQVRILHFLFEREATVLSSQRNIQAGMTTPQIWKKIYPLASKTSTATFRGYILDLQDKGLIQKTDNPDYWTTTAKAQRSRVLGFSS